MAKLGYIARGGGSPQGRPKVYFCCHPADRERYFDRLTREVFAHANCSVWFDEQPDVPADEAYFDDLAQMNLFVLPVTTNLLIKPCRALSEEFVFAQEKHIPVLPLMQESGLEELYERKIGNLQYLDKQANDPTALGYDEKLKRYLERVLVSDEQAEKIRKAFDAYVFLSYRKKDRKAAQELMRLIHDNDFCRDVAIWYDEFLTPGEDFNEMIRAALEKSDLFAMAVTPNLVNEQNYVMSTEYPAAAKAEKPMLAAELQPTDRAALEAMAGQYAPGCAVPACTDPRDARQLAAALADGLRSIALQRHKDDPEHDFLMGLAYLSGVDVETDYARAVPLIAAAAEREVPEAMETLAEMYHAGLAVQRDYDKEVQWLEKLAELRRKAYEAQPSEETLVNAWQACTSCGCTYLDLWQVGKAKVWIEKAVRLQRQVSPELLQELDSVEVQIRIACGYHNLGDVCREEGNISAARQWTEKAVALRETLVQETGTVEARSALATSCNNLGYLYQAEGNLSAARQWTEKAVALRETLVQETGTVDARSALATSYSNLGHHCEAEGDPSAARQWCEKAAELCEALVQETGTVEARSDLADSCNKLGYLCQKEGNLFAAQQWYEKAVALQETLAQETGTAEARYNLADSCINLGNLFQAEGNLFAARQWCEKVVALWEELVHQTGTVQVCHYLAIGCVNLGTLCRAEGDLSAAQQWFEKGLARLEVLVRENPQNQVYKNNLQSVQNELRRM